MSYKLDLGLLLCFIAANPVSVVQVLAPQRVVIGAYTVIVFSHSYLVVVALHSRSFLPVAPLHSQVSYWLPILLAGVNGEIGSKSKAYLRWLPILLAGANGEIGSKSKAC